MNKPYAQIESCCLARKFYQIVIVSSEYIVVAT